MPRVAVVLTIARRSSCVVQAHESSDSSPFGSPQTPLIADRFSNDDSCVSARRFVENRSIGERV
jgi:hypothetical protein